MRSNLNCFPEYRFDLLLKGVCLLGMVIPLSLSYAESGLPKKHRPEVSRPAATTEHAFCSNPFKAICGDQARSIERFEEGRARENRFFDVRAPVMEKLQKKAEKPISMVDIVGPSGVHRDYDRAPKEPPKVPEENLPLYKDYLQFTYEEIEKRFEIDENEPFKMRARLVSAIQNEYASKFGKQGDLEKGVKQLNSAQVVVSGNSLLGLMFPDGSVKSADREFIDRFSFVCQREGTRAMAFYYAPKNSVVLCPGLLVKSAFTQGERPKINWESLAHLIGHELGHAVDSERQPSLYKKYSGCIQVAPRMLKEVSADFWGGIVLGDKLENERLLKNRLRIVREATQSSCDTADEKNWDAAHLGKEERFNRVLRSHPKIAAAFECKRKESVCEL